MSETFDGALSDLKAALARIETEAARIAEEHSVTKLDAIAAELKLTIESQQHELNSLRKQIDIDRETIRYGERLKAQLRKLEAAG